MLLRRLSSNVSMMNAFHSEIRNPYFAMNEYETGWLVCFCKREGERGRHKLLKGRSRDLVLI